MALAGGTPGVSDIWTLLEGHPDGLSVITLQSSLPYEIYRCFRNRAICMRIVSAGLESDDYN